MQVVAVILFVPEGGIHGFRNERPILIYRVDDLDSTVARLKDAGWETGEVFEIPHGPCCSLHTPGGHRIAVYQPTRPDATTYFEGQHDF
jgi:predicted enzyme related to lactoylglutathione lyase